MTLPPVMRSARTLSRSCLLYTSGEGAYYNQRRRWIAAQFYALGSAVRQLPGAIAAGNLDYCDKLLQLSLIHISGLSCTKSSSFPASR